MKHETEIRRIILHALGVTDHTRATRPYRNHYCHSATPALVEAVEAKLMFGPSAGASSSQHWYVTEAGAAFVGEELPTWLRIIDR